jgi:hypothetical protein
MSATTNHDKALELIKELKLNEAMQGSSIVYRMFAFQNILDLGVTQSYLAEKLRVNQSYISSTIRLKELPEEVLVMVHAGSAGKDLSIPIKGLKLTLPRASGGSPKGITYKKVSRMLAMLPSKSSQSYRSEFDNWFKFMSSYETLDKASSTTDLEFEEWLRSKYLEGREPMSLEEVADFIFKNKSEIGETMLEMIADLVVSGDSSAIKLVRKLMEKGQLSI